MDEKLQGALAAIINKTVNGIDAGVAFLSAQIPDVLQQLLHWKAAEAGVWFFVCIATAVTVIFFSIRWYREEKKDKWGMGEFVVLPLALAAFLGFIAVANFMTMLQIVIAPKVYLIEYAAKLVTK